MKWKFLILLFCLTSALFGRVSLLPPHGRCDTVFTQDGRLFLVRSWVIRGNTLEYRLCEQTIEDTRGRLPLSSIREIRCSPRPKEGTPYKVWAHLHDNPTPVTGFLLMTTDSSILLSKKPKGDNPGKIVELPIRQVDKIKLSPRGKLGKCVAAGAAIGLGSGFILGYASGDDKEGFFTFTKEEKARLGAIALGFTGTITGLIVGLQKKVIKLNGSAENYRLYRPLLNKYALKGK